MKKIVRVCDNFRCTNNKNGVCNKEKCVLKPTIVEAERTY